MSLRRYLRHKDGLPNPRGSLSSSMSSIAAKEILANNYNVALLLLTRLPTPFLHLVVYSLVVPPVSSSTPAPSSSASSTSSTATISLMSLPPLCESLPPEAPSENSGKDGASLGISQ